jgi:predicted transcriptional regulator of viral defense system
MKSYCHLIDYINDLRKQGKYLFLKEEASQALTISESAVLNSISRLLKKKKIAHLKKGLYQIIPEEYALVGSLPPEWFLADLMDYLKVPYYIGLLTAASFHGAAHQAPQIFQVVCQRRIPDMTMGALKIRFYYSKDFSVIPTQNLKTPAGYVNLSTPEGTAFDLLRYLHQSGHLNHVATVLTELADVMDPYKLSHLAQQGLSIRYAQRLGYLLDYLGHESLAAPLHHIVSEKTMRYIPLRPDTPAQDSQKNVKWHILINEIVEADL